MVLYTIVDTTNTIASSFSDNKVYWGYVYSVRELHNIAEGLIDPYFAKCLDETGKEIPCYTDYWKHIKYLNFPFKIEIPNNMMIWQSKDVDTKTTFFNKPQP